MRPLQDGVFRMLWMTWLTAHVCMWMNDVAAAWMMTSLTKSPIWVALVQTASTLPVFLLGIPSGALADLLDRRRFLILTQFWGGAVALLLALTILSGVMTPPLLLALTFANGICLAMRLPVFAAIVPELVPRSQLPAALALNLVAMNASRIIGPLVAGVLIASAGTLYVFILNAVLSLTSGLVIMRWRRQHIPSPLGRERFLSAMRVGVQFVCHSAPLKLSLLRIFLFFFHSCALVALLPLVAHGFGQGASIYTLLLASMGLGAIVAVLLLPRLRLAVSRDVLVMGGAALNFLSMAVAAFSPNLYVAVPAMFLAGTSYTAVANSLGVSAQLALPDWVRARGMSMYQMAIMGASALGAALWGQVATLASLHVSLSIAAISGAVTIVAAYLLTADPGDEEDNAPVRDYEVPAMVGPVETGRMLVTVEYRIDPGRIAEFRALMRETRRSRLRRGALSWRLLHDLADAGRFVEQIVDESWSAHLRRADRMTAADAALRQRRLAFHIGEDPPLVTRCVIDASARR